MKFLFIIDPIQKLDPGHDTSVALMEAAQQLGHEIWITEIGRLSVLDGRAAASMQPVQLVPVDLVEGRWVAANPWFEVGDRHFRYLDEMDAIFMRTDPPVNVPYLYATYILDYVDPTKTLVVNSPNGLRLANEKMYALQFTEAIPTTIVATEKAVIREFIEKHGAAVLKPLGGKGGEGILFVEASDRNFNSLVEISTQQGQYPIMVQTYLPAAKDGDKRVILLDGEPLGAVNRIPSGGDFRGNMAVGGRVAGVDVTERDRDICNQLAPTLKRDGLFFVGIDIIGGYLTEVNVTSPTGIREIDRLSGLRLGHQVMEWVVGRCNKPEMK
ncbi:MULTISPECIES: glutathione synthase [unclassified Leptolyngbya]|uniref:glutathione synthase n=1 Tax=unclassified Leptolyngbya TaxID=2650499 RepID=UPI00168292D3|nr:MULTISPECIES: glutathione synthase [unclassified Leptolyngbya]MBD1914201.1 glutathione synthase [Leptolyngbya sp. FACHB-8]MBD2157208.1 glutathione synthase [Leptolyngbya sp. FACHB-16]